MERHYELLGLFSEALKKANLKLKAQKCEFLKKKGNQIWEVLRKEIGLSLSTLTHLPVEWALYYAKKEKTICSIHDILLRKGCRRLRRTPLKMTD
ncbi:hypothetical protein OESDEN_00098 [Oesophagostomum dentatum]|uniref:Uncharacterized protein n=1 Tax=Oesophagostomum dentatum TaxID=61180 RepID=A0A0B1TQS8_OESDE|nr:hypothetical protein OESDEN_00098 [Oesophagostomum dentatum]